MVGFTTRRLAAVPLTLDDAPLFERLWGDDRVGQTLGGTRDAQQVRQALTAGVEHWERHGFGRWVLWAGDEQVGTVKLAVWKGRGRPEVELGYALLTDFWGQGYATEAGEGALRHAEELLDLTQVVAFTLPENRASLSVMQRLGFDGKARVVLAGREHILSERHLG